MEKQTGIKEATEKIKDGMTLMVGGFLANGTPEAIMDEIAAQKTSCLTLIVNDGGLPGKGVAKLIAAGLVKKLITTHIGMNPQVLELVKKGSLDLELVPQGTLAERIRAGGAGLGGVLTRTGLGTEVAEGKTILTIDGEPYLLERPLRADIALIRGSVIDEAGNIFYRGTTRNFNSVMAMAADVVIAEAQKLVQTGSLCGEQIMTPGIFVDYIVGGEAHE